MKYLLRCAALAALACLPAQAHAWPPNGNKVKVDAGVDIRFNVYLQDQPSAPVAPWYMYWPVEASTYQSASPLGTLPFPNWPSTWPPAAKATSGSPGGPTPTSPTGAGPAASPFGAPKQSSFPPGIAWMNSGSAIQPVGYSGPVPSYWYGQ